MAMIEYIEPANAGDVFIGMGGLILTLTLAYIFYRFYVKFCQYLDVVINREAKYEILEETFLDKIAKEKGIDLTKELVRRKMFEDTRRKSFRRKLEEQIYDEMFGKDSEIKK